VEQFDEFEAEEPALLSRAIQLKPDLDTVP
jgi:hypothetical protein